MSVNKIHGFLEWKEHFVSQERGSRVVHYYFKDTAGESVLAVVGTERSLRHMVYVVSEEFLQVYGSDKSISSSFKWRSRREVVDWLTSLLSKQRPSRDCSKSPKNDPTQALGYPDFSSDGLGAPGAHVSDHKSRFARKLKGHNSDIVWSSDSWTCGKQLKHYPVFCRNGITITIHSFVYIMGKEENHYLAYLEDMYEDRKGQKKVRVRWFHDNQEVKGVISLPNPHPREVFITPHAQVISAECVDGPATVLTPEHYEKCSAILPNVSSSRIHLCSKQFRSNKIKSFDLSKLRGYFEQIILSCLEDDEVFSQGGPIKQGAKRTRSCRGRQRFVTSRSGVRLSGWGNHTTACEPAYQNLRFELSDRGPMAFKYVGPQVRLMSSFKVDEKIELLCQDSGIRGCWFRCTILKASHKKLKVRYDDVQDGDGCGNLEEWIHAFRPAAPDKLGMRCSGRLTIRPCPPPEDLTNVTFEIGTPVDAWWNDAWWEGVLTEIDNCGNDGLQVYFPGEDVFSTFQRSKLRSSRDWVGDQWVNIEVKPDILLAISAAVSPGMKLSTCSSIVKGVESGRSAMSECQVPTALKLDTVLEDKEELAGSAESDQLQENVKWADSRKQLWIEDEVKGDGDDDQNEDEEDTEDNEDNSDDDVGCKLDAKEDIEAARQRCEAEPMEMAT